MPFTRAGHHYFVPAEDETARQFFGRRFREDGLMAAVDETETSFPDVDPLDFLTVVQVKPCPCDCNSGGFCGGCGHAGCGGRR